MFILQIFDMTTARLQGAPHLAFTFVLKICTDTYKIIDKNIPLLTICLEERGNNMRPGAFWEKKRKGGRRRGAGREG